MRIGVSRFGESWRKKSVRNRTHPPAVKKSGGGLGVAHPIAHGSDATVVSDKIAWNFRCEVVLPVCPLHCLITLRLLEHGVADDYI